MTDKELQEIKKRWEAHLIAGVDIAALLDEITRLRRLLGEIP